MAAILAGVWLLAGLLALILGFARHNWLAVLLGPLAVGYGVLWVRVAQTGRSLQWPARRHRR